MKNIIASAALLIALGATNAWAHPTIVELYTAQGCAACPTADVVLRHLEHDPSILPLTFHVDYWNNLGWEDPFALPESTERQNEYEKLMGIDSVFTPQIIVDGSFSVIGSQQDKVLAAIGQARQMTGPEVPITIVPNKTGTGVDINIGAPGGPAIPPDATLTEIHFNRSSITKIGAGENHGKVLESFNNVIAVVPLEIAAHYALPFKRFQEDGITFILQEKSGKVIGAGVYIKPAKGSGAL